MKLYLKYNINVSFKRILQDKFNKMGVEYDLASLNEVDIKKEISPEDFKQLNMELNEYGIEIVENQKNALVQKIKDTIMEMIYIEEKLPTEKISSYLGEKLNHSYSYIANLFSAETYTTIENFIIFQKIEYAKQLMIAEGLTLTEVAYRLNYSSTAHLSAQFKKTTGLTASVFQRIIAKRHESLEKVEEMI